MVAVVVEKEVMEVMMEVEEEEQAVVIFKKVMSLTWKSIILFAGYYKFCLMIVILGLCSKIKIKSGSEDGDDDHEHININITGAIAAGILSYLAMCATTVTFVLLDLSKKFKSYLMIKEEECKSTYDMIKDHHNNVDSKEQARLDDIIRGPMIHLPALCPAFFLIFSLILYFIKPNSDGDYPYWEILWLPIIFIFPIMLFGHTYCFYYLVYRELNSFLPRKQISEFELAAAAQQQQQQQQSTDHNYNQKTNKRISSSCPQMEASCSSSASTYTDLPLCPWCSANEKGLLKEEDDNFFNDFRDWEKKRNRLVQEIHDAIN